MQYKLGECIKFSEKEEKIMKIRNKLGRICCAMLAVLMLVTSMGMPSNTYAATNNHPYYIKINRKQNCVTV